jgi:hypothetical protein
MRIMPVAGGGFEHNAQTVVAADNLLVVATNVVQAANSLPSRKRRTSSNSNRCWPAGGFAGDLGKPQTMLGDAGYFSAANVTPLLRPR